MISSGKAINFVRLPYYTLLSFMGIISILSIFFQAFFLINKVPIVIAIGVLFLLSIIFKIWEEKLESAPDVEKMELLLRFFYNARNYKDVDSVNIVIHKKKDEYEYIRYTNTIKHNGMEFNRGDTFPVEKGIVRKAFESNGGEFCDIFKTDDEKKKRLVSDYNYTENEAIKMLEDRKKSYYCKTIVHNGRTWGVLYMTSTSYAKFSSPTNKIPVDFSKKVTQLLEMIQNEIL